MTRSLFTYISIIGVFIALMFLIAYQGKNLEHKAAAASADKTGTVENKTPPAAAHAGFIAQLKDHVQQPLSLLLLQIIVILVVSRVFGVIAKLFGQQTVIGEIIAGIILGPSLFGWMFPEVSAFIFPVDSLKSLQFLSQIGLAFFMFIIGMELDISKLKNKAHDAVVISHASIVFPYFLGMGLAYFIYESFAPPTVDFLSFSLFMGIAMSITAFPVLARIIQERGLTKTNLGALAITCAAADDVTAWCILAAVIAIAKAGSMVSSLFTIGLALLFVLSMIYILKPFLEKIGKRFVESEKTNKSVVAISFFILLCSAYFAEVIGIHALFGAFIAGVVMPKNLRFREALSEKVHDLSVLLLLPIFFAFTGLRTQIGLLNQGHLWALCGIVILVAVVGKFFGSALAAKLVGRTWKDSLSIGALMNTRGLMELIVLNIGYDLKILSPEIFAIMVLMALATTFMTGPTLNLINYVFKESKEEQAEAVST
jgi:Kef-type K+ transport system membrane component KefB